MSFRPIILAEDHTKLRRVYADLLEVAGFKVLHAADGEKAIDLLHKVVNPQLIVLDVMMPRMNGIEACVRIRKMQGPRPCPILFLTALDDPADVLKCLRAGGDDFLMKSAPLSEFLSRVQHWARRGVSDEGSARHFKAIAALEQMTQQFPLRSRPQAAAGIGAGDA